MDTPNVKEIQEAASLGALYGMTTTPSLVAKKDLIFHETVVEICHLVYGPISAEVVSLDADAMAVCADELVRIIILR